MQRSLADRLVKPVWFSFGGQTWPLLITYGVLLECESETDADMLTSTEGIVSPTAKVLLTLFWAALNRCGCSWNLRTVGGLIGPRDWGAIQRALQQAYVASLPDPEKPKLGKKGDKPREPMTWPQTRAAARIELGLSDEELLAMTPRELHDLRVCYIAKLQREELFFSRLTTSVINFSMRGTKEWLAEDHFMIHPLPKPERKPVDIGAAFDEFEQRGR